MIATYGMIQLAVQLAVYNPFFGFGTGVRRCKARTGRVPGVIPGFTSCTGDYTRTETEDSAWLGYSVGDAMRLEDCYRRLDRDNVELTIMIDNPKTYPKPWVSEKKTLSCNRKTQLRENFFVPSEEQARSFNKRMRDPIAGKTGKELARESPARS
jgi:hypothetical protein